MNLKLVTLLLLLVAASSLCQASEKDTVQIFQHLLNTSTTKTTSSTGSANEAMTFEDYNPVIDAGYYIAPTEEDYFDVYSDTDEDSDNTDICGAYQPGKDTCDKCGFPSIDYIEEVNQYSLNSGNPIAAYLNQSIAEKNLMFAVMTFDEELQMVWNYSYPLPFASQITVTAYGSLTQNETFRPIDSCCGVALNTGLRICNLGEMDFESYYVRISFLRSTFTTSVYTRNLTEGLGRNILNIHPDTTDILVQVKNSIGSIRNSFYPTDKYKYICLFNMDKNDVMNKHTGQELQLSQVYDREVYKMPQHRYIKNGLYDSAGEEVECNMEYIKEDISDELEFNNSNLNTFTCLTLVLDKRNDTFRDVLCLPHKKNDYLNRLYHENSNEKGMLITVACLVMVVVLLIIIVAMVFVGRYLKETRQSDMEIPANLAEVCKEYKTEKNSIGDFIHWELPSNIEQEPTSIDKSDKSDAQIYHQVDRPLRLPSSSAEATVSISYVTIKFRSECDTSSSTSRDNVNHQHDDDDTSSRDQVTSSAKHADYEDNERESRGIGDSSSSNDFPRSSDGYSPKEALEYKSSPSPSPQECAGGDDNAVFESDEDATKMPENQVFVVSPYMDKSFVM